MYSMAELLARALASPRIHFNRAEGTDRITDGLISITVRPLNPADILTPEEVAARLKVPESWVYEKTRARCRNPMPCLRLGRYIRFDWAAVIIWLTAEADQQERAARPSLQKKR